MSGLSSASNQIQEIEPKTATDVSVVIVNYNVKDFLSQALASVLRAAEGLEVEIFVVDNNSIDDSVLMVQQDYPSVKLIANSENVGFGKANNQAIRQACGRHILILNPDTIVQEDSLRTMVAFMDSHPDCGALGCQILNPDGSFAPESRRSFPTPEIAFYRMIGLSTLFPKSERFGKYNLTYLPKDLPSEVDALSGSCMMVRRDAFFGINGKQKAGLFDEDFFMYGEDLDLCFRIQEAGWTVWYSPETQIIHYKGESTKKGELRYVKLFYGAMLLFIEKHLEVEKSSPLAIFLRFGILIRAGLTLLGNGIRSSSSVLKDVFSVYLCVALIGAIRFAQTDVSMTPLFFATIAPAFALSTSLAIGFLGGYRMSRRNRIEPVIPAVLVGFLTVASLAYFIEPIAFSRFAIGLSVPISVVVLSVIRALASRKDGGFRKALLVGDSSEANRLSNLLATHPKPPFILKGFVSEDGLAAGSVPHLGRVSHIRDLVRLVGFDDIVFASRDVPNHVIFGIMKNLHDLPVQFRMLQQGQDHVIGKASINHLSLRELQTDVAEVLEIRSPFSKFLFEKFVALLILPAWPFLWFAEWVSTHPGAVVDASKRMIPPEETTLRKFVRIPEVLTGKVSLIGCLPEHQELVPDNWELPIGLFSITNSMRSKELETQDLTRAYWYYVTHQTPGLDLEILLASIQSPG